MSHGADPDPCTPASLEQYARVIEALDRDTKETAA